MLRVLLSLLRPFKTIADELRIIRQLYELDLESRKPPIYRTTEKPSKRDTEVSYAGVPDDRPFWKRWQLVDDDDSDEVEVESEEES